MFGKIASKINFWVRIFFCALIFEKRLQIIPKYEIMIQIIL